MAHDARPSTAGEHVWLGAVVVLTIAMAVTALGPGADSTVLGEVALFWFVVIGAGVCLLGGLAGLAVALREGTGELGLLSTLLSVVSLLPLVHGLTVPGVLYGPNDATAFAVLVAGPLGLAAGWPLVVPRTSAARWVGRRWRGWSTSVLALASLAAAVLLIRPDTAPTVATRTPLTLGVGFVTALGMLAVSWTQVRLHGLSRRAPTLVVAVALVAIATSNLVWLAPGPSTASFWLAHGLDVFGVAVAAIVAAIAYRHGDRVRRVIEPLAEQDPIGALALGLDPVVHAFVAALDDADEITRHHVVRTSALAIRVGEELRLPPERLRAVGMGALLHDIGKLLTPQAVLTKPDRLDEHERAVINRHTTDGESLLAASESLRGAAVVARSHHERVDGGGYPDGLVGESIALEARIVAVCDAFDAMANTRHYRVGMGEERALAVLREHAGSQWDPSCVTALAAVVEHGGVPDPGRLDRIGEPVPSAPVQQCCLDALPTGWEASAVSPAGSRG